MSQRLQRRKPLRGPKPRLSSASLNEIDARPSLTLKGSKLSVSPSNNNGFSILLIGLELKKVAKRLAGKYACGCSVVKMPAGHEEVALQGEFIDDLVDFIPTEFPEIKPHQIEVNIK